MHVAEKLSKKNKVNKVHVMLSRHRCGGYKLCYFGEVQTLIMMNANQSKAMIRGVHTTILILL